MHVRDEGLARMVAERMLPADADDAERDELVSALVGGELLLIRVGRSRRTLDAPRVQSLVDLVETLDGVPEPPRPDAWIAVEVVDQRGRPLPQFRVELRDPSGATHSLALDDQAAARVDELAQDGSCTFTLRGPQ